MLEPPPPRRPSYANDDDNEEREATLEENKLQAMLEDPDNFEDYPKDWDRYVSGYVVSFITLGDMNGDLAICLKFFWFNFAGLFLFTQDR